MCLKNKEKLVDIIPMIIGKCLHEDIDRKISIKSCNADFFPVTCP